MITLLQKEETLKLIEKIKQRPLPTLGSLKIEDFYQLLEQYSPPFARRFLTLVLPWLRPFSKGRWFRVARLNDEEIELVIPMSSANTNAQGGLHEAIIMGAAVEAINLFWWRHIQETPQIMVRDCSFKSLKKAFGELRLRAQVPESTLELVLYSLRCNQVARVEVPLKAFDQNENLIAEIEVSLEISLTPQLQR